MRSLDKCRIVVNLSLKALSTSVSSQECYATIGTEDYIKYQLPRIVLTSELHLAIADKIDVEGQKILRFVCFFLKNNFGKMCLSLNMKHI